MAQYGTNSITKVTVSQLPTPVAFLYDSNGNLTNDTLRSLSYNDENELTDVTVTGQWKADYFYDGFGRRRISRDYTWSGAWYLTNEVHYIYDGKLVIQERNTNNTIIANYDRGLDLSGSLQGAGGVGGLLARTDIKGTVYYHSDAQGNVVTLVDRYQTLEGRYLYDPYGSLVGKWGPYVDVNHYRYASMEYLPLPGIYNSYGRYYDPNLQRFLNRDPLGEAGGINLYGYVGNDPMNSIDPFGLCPWSWNRFGNWELGVLTDAKQFFAGKSDDGKLDPNSLLYLSNQAGVGNTALTDKDGNVISATDLAFDVFTQPLIALASGGVGDIAELAGSGEVAASGIEAAETTKAAESAVGIDAGILRSFTGSQAAKSVLDNDLTVTRVFDKIPGVTDGSSEIGGRFFTTTTITSSAQAQESLALAGFNQARFVESAVIPRGTTIYQGTAARLGNLSGGGVQIFVPNISEVQFYGIRQLK